MRTGAIVVTLIVGSVSLTGAQEPSPVGMEFQVNTYTTGSQLSPDVARAASGEFVVVWESPHDGSGFGVFGQRFDSGGMPVGAEFQANTYTTGGQFQAAVAMADGGQFVVVWDDTTQQEYGNAIFGQLYDSSGGTVGGEFRVNTYPYGSEDHPDVGMASSGSFVVVWESNDDGSSSGIAGQRFSSTGTKLGDEFEVNTQTANIQRNPSIAMRDSGDFVVVWQSLVQDGSSESVVAQLFDPLANPLGDEFVVNTYTTDSQERPAVSMTDSGDFVVVWDSRNQDGSSNGIFGQRFSSGGTPVGAEFQANTYTTGGQYQAAVAIAPWNEFIVLWESGGQDGDSLGVFGQAFDSAGVKVGSEFLVPSETLFRQRRPAAAVSDNGEFIVTWSDNFQESILNEGIRGQRFLSGIIVFTDGFESGDTSAWSGSFP